MRFSLLDLALIGGLAASAYLGFRSGAMRKAVMLAGLIAALFLAALLAVATAPYVRSLGMEKLVAEVLVFLLVIAAVMLLLVFLYRRFSKTSPGHVSGRVAGTLFGLLQGVFTMSLILIALDLISLPDRETRQSSLLYGSLVQVVPRTFAALRAHMPGADEVKRSLKDRL